jgi:CobQ-like glutamine amidotransferase family enzyme
MKTDYSLDIAYLYPRSMNIYGDKGNIITLMKRCQWRNITVNIHEIENGEELVECKYDLFFAGGGQDKSQLAIAKDLQKKSKEIEKAVEKNKVFLLICGSYQLFGHYFQTFNNQKIPGISIFDLITIASNKRKIGNVSINLSPEIFPQNSINSSNTLVGFENHSGNTFITPNSLTKPLGKIISGFGNNGKDKTEGAVCNNCFGTYFHGSLLPKNPHFADFLIKTALQNKYKEEISLETLNDTFENQAHNFILKNR